MLPIGTSDRIPIGLEDVVRRMGSISAIKRWVFTLKYIHYLIMIQHMSGILTIAPRRGLCVSSSEVRNTIYIYIFYWKFGVKHYQNLDKQKKTIIYIMGIELVYIWTNWNPLYPQMRYAKFGWNWSSGSWEDFLYFVDVFFLFHNYLP